MAPGAFAAAALLLLVPVPFWLGLFGALWGAIQSYRIVAMNSVPPKPSEMADALSSALFSPLAGLVLMGPSLIAAILGSTIRSLWGETSNSRVTP